jgi:hypothetical protein
MEINIFLVLVKLRGSQDGNTTFPPILLFHLNKTGTQAEARISFALLIAGMDLGFGRLLLLHLARFFIYGKAPFVSPEVLCLLW